MDVRAGGGYRLAFGRGGSSMVFFGKYLEVSRSSRLVWTKEESDGGAVTTVTFEDNGGRTLLVLKELSPSKEVLDAAFVGMEDAMPEQFDQLADLLIALSAKV